MVSNRPQPFAGKDLTGDVRNHPGRFGRGKRAFAAGAVRRSEAPEYQVRFRWEVGSIAIWDNRSTWHYGVADYAGWRHLERVAVMGDRPKRAVG